MKVKKRQRVRKTMDKEKLQRMAIEAADRAYVPYSKFQVGAALLCENGDIVTGCNVENLSLGLSNCGERTAVFTAVAQGQRRFKAIAIYSPQAADYLAPCGACRQVLDEFVGADFTLYMGNGRGEFTEKKFIEIFPASFKEEF
jgi:cytidine deaminase